jgi:hypothetical protein
MLKAMAISALFLCYAVSLHVKAQTSTHVQPDSKDNQQTASANAANGENQKPSNDSNRNSREKAEREQDLQTIFNGLLVAVGVATCVVVGWQAIETREAARASVKSADAAKLNADALINSERAWLLVTDDGFCGDFSITKISGRLRSFPIYPNICSVEKKLLLTENGLLHKKSILSVTLAPTKATLMVLLPCLTRLKKVKGTSGYMASFAIATPSLHISTKPGFAI